MDKNGLRKFVEWSDREDDGEKEIYLKELGNAVHSYIKTGVKTKQLDEMIEVEETFRKRYEERFDAKKIAESISQENTRRAKEIGMAHLQEVEKKGGKSDTEKKYILSGEKVSGIVIEIAAEVIEKKLQKVIRDAAYLSHINMLYELYEQEEQLRREEREYERISEKYRKMAEITKKLSEQKRMELECLEEQVTISRKDLEELVSRNEKYFNVRNRQGTVLISLSPTGRKYYEYVMNSSDKCSRETMIQAVYKNCDTLMEAIESSYVSGIEHEIRLEEMPPEKERAIRFRYRRMLRRIEEEKEEVYTTKNYIVKEKKESEYSDNEKNRIRIPRYWDYEGD